MEPSGRICAIIVTHNRKSELIKCLNALLAQTRHLDQIIVVDNASTDGTMEMIAANFAHHPVVAYHNLNANLGGGGGFHYGSHLAVDRGYDWIWLMDDDCCATEECLEKLVRGVTNSKDIYSPIVLSIEDRETVLWGIKAAYNSGTTEVGTLPFIGFFIHRRSLKEIGFPGKEFFIYGDDTEFNMRARTYGKKIIMVTDSIMYHPYKNALRGLKIYKMFLNKLWAYYKLRNAIIIFKKYRYVSKKQVVMFGTALIFYILTLKFDFMKLWLEGLKDGINGKLYVKSSLS